MTLPLPTVDGRLVSSEFKELIDALPTALFIKDGRSRFVLMNRACEEQWGMSFADLSGTDGSQFFPPDQMERFLAKDREVYEGGRQIDVEEPYWSARLQENRVGHTFKKPIYDADGRPLFLVGITVDVTERKRIEAELRTSDEKLRGLYRLSKLGIALTDMQGHYVEFNGAFERICGYTREELNRLDYWALTPKEYAEQEARQLELLQTTGSYGPYEKEYVRKDGMRVPLRLNGVLIHGSDGGTYIWSVVEDISERKRAEESMRLASLIYQTSTEAIIVTDENNRIVDINDAFTRITGYGLDEIRGMNPSLMKSGLHDEAFYGQFWQSVREQDHWQGEIWDRRKDGTLIAKWMHVNVIRNPDGSIYRHVAQFSDVTERKQKDEIIWRQANFDALTELPNRRLFRDRLEQEIKKAHRDGQRVGLLFVDLDRFKDINDTLGHDRGDMLLVEAARRIRGCVRESDTVARLGGDEFTVIVPEYEAALNVERVARAILQALAEPFDLGGEQGYVSASMGITLYPDDAADIESLLKHADRAMYQAKEYGRNQFAYFTASMQQHAEARLALTNELRHALERQELEVYYQPIVDLASGEIVKAEALLRWRHPQRGMVGPMEFIPLAEESGLILEIGEWVFREAVASVGRWRDRFGRVIPVSVNKSPVQFSQERSGENWLDALRALGLPGNSITVEITEGMLVKDSPRVKSRLLEFRNLGVEVSIDDFGTGFSSLSYLKQFHIDFLKIDRSFVSSLTDSESDRALTEAIIVMAHKLGIRTIAEGIETEAQRDILIGFGCDYAQGYLFSRPVPRDAFEGMLLSSRDRMR